MPDFEILWINLDRDAERRAWMEPQLERLGLTARRIPALTPETTPVELRSRFLPEAENVLLPNNIASFASHLMVAEEIAGGSRDAAVVLEDDVEILCSGAELAALVEAARELDMVKLNDWSKSPTVAIGHVAGRKLVRYLRVPRGAGSYILTRSGAERMLERARNLAITTDNFLRAEGMLTLRIAGVLPPPIPQDRLQRSSLDPEGLRNRARNRRYFYRPPGGTGALPRLRFLACEFGWPMLGRLALVEGLMRLRREKRDTEGRYLLKR